MLAKSGTLALMVGVIAVACGGPDFQATDDEGGGGAGAEGVDTAGAGGAVTAGEGGSVAAGGSDMPAAGEGGAAAGGAPASGPSIVIVRASRTSITGNVDPSITLTEPPAAGNALIVGITCFSEVENCVIPEGGVSDDQGNEYTLVIEGASIVSSDTHGSRPYLFIAENVAASAGPLTISVNANGGPPDDYQNFAWGVLEVSGLLPAGSVDQTGSSPNTCCFPSTTVSTEAATSQANELAVAVHSARSNDDDNHFNYGHDPAWTQHHVNQDGTSVASQHSLVARVLSEAGVVSHSWTHDEPTRGVAAIIATFRGAAP